MMRSLLILSFFMTAAVFQPLASMPNDKTASTLGGRVTEHSGRPLVGVKVSISNEGTLVSRTETNGQGAYLFTRLAPGTYSVSAELIGFLPTTDELYIGPNEEVIRDLGMEVGLFAPAECTLEIKGKVIQANGEAGANATISFVNAFNRKYFRQYRTDGKGQFRFEESEYGQYLVYANKPGFSVASAPVSFPPQRLKAGGCHVEKTVTLTLGSFNLE